MWFSFKKCYRLRANNFTENETQREFASKEHLSVAASDKNITTAFNDTFKSF